MEFGKYRLVRKLAQGGMAQLFLAIQRGPHGFEKVLVLKCVLPEICKVQEFVDMFLDEARLAAHLDHNNVVRVYDFGQVGGQYFLAMEYLPGEDLASIIQTCRKSEKPIPVDIATDVIIGAASGLHFAHEMLDARGHPLNIVHRDVSPSNVIVTYHGTIKLVDFGIARAESNVIKTAAGMLKGKFAYLSPEQAVGDPVDRRSDVFALGAVMQELLTGCRVFRRESDLATLKAVAQAEVEPPSRIRSDIPEDLDRIVMKAMARAPPDRYQTAADMAEDLVAFLARRGYVRSEKHLADYLTATFGEERRLNKLRVSGLSTGSDESVIQRTPSLIRDLPKDLSPIRSDSDIPVAPPDTNVTRRGADGLQPTIPEAPSYSLILKSRRQLVVGGVGLALLIAVIAGIVWRRGPSETQTTSSVQRPPVPTETVQPETSPTPPSTQAKVEVRAPTPPVPPPAEVAPKPSPAAKHAAKGKLSLDTTPWVEVFLNGKNLGETPLINVPLPAGRHVLKLVNETKGIHSAIEVEIEAGKTTLKKLDL
jgi:eukaryotic-like serine/threonine-protein kinase